MQKLSGPACYIPYFVFVLHAYFLISFLLCVLLACLSCLSDFLMYVSFYLALLYNSPPYPYAYALLYLYSTSLSLCILTCYLTVHLCVHSQSTYVSTVLLMCSFSHTCILVCL